MAVFWKGYLLRIVDCHVHLQDESFARDLGEVLCRARAAGVVAVVCNGCSEANWETVLELAEKEPGIVPCAGLHPWYIAGRSEQWAQKLEEIVRSHKVGVGEIGLDRWIEDRDEAAQEEVFCTQLALARTYNRPAMIHCLQAWGPMMDIMRKEKPFEAGILFHAYGGPVELMRELVNKNAYFSFAGSVLREKNVRSRAAATAVPLDRLLVETDSPDIPLPKHFQVAGLPNERRNEPANAAAVLKGIAELRGMEVNELAQIVWENATRFLKDLWSYDT